MILRTCQFQNRDIVQEVSKLHWNKIGKASKQSQGYISYCLQLYIKEV